MWKKRDDARCIEDVIVRNSGQAIEKLLLPKGDTRIVHLEQAAELVKEAIEQKSPITVVGDYDADGICGSAILFLLFQQLGKEVSVRLPRRFSEGYGLSKAILDEIAGGLLLTVDNGITAVEEITEAKRRGITVVVLDHHTARKDGVLPEADVLVNPHVEKENPEDFDGFCGAGLAYRLACLLQPDKDKLCRLSALAAIATVADVVPLLDDNRKIVKEGFQAINRGKGPAGLNALLEHLNLFDVDENDISFTIGPVLNAPGRMFDDGAMLSFRMLTATECLDSAAENLIAVNEKRKAEQAENIQLAENIITDDCLFGDNVLLVASVGRPGHPPIPEGLAGIIAGRLADKYKVPAFVLTQSEAEDELKGSGRSYGDVDIIALLEKAAPYLVTFGGHPKAAGLTVKKDNVEPLRDFLKEQVPEPKPDKPDNDLYYDLEVDAELVPGFIEALRYYAPFGEGNAPPVILIKEQPLLPRSGKCYTYMGKEGEHIKLYCGKKMTAVGFGLAERYMQQGEPIRVNMIGTISTNKYIDPVGRATKENQIRIVDVKKAERRPHSSSLLSSIHEHLKEIGGYRGDC